MPDLLIELLSEEIPARMQERAAEDLRRLMTDGLVEAGLTYSHAQAHATPRRLTLAIEGLTERSRPMREERKGPRTDAPPQAIEGFLRATGLTLDRLERRAEKKGEVYFAVIERPGREAAEIVAEVLGRTIRDFPWPKSMRWGTGSLRWVRPLQSILCLLVRDSGPEVVPFEIGGLVAANTTRGHRFHAPQGFSVTSFEDYEARLRRAHVLLRAGERMERIRHDATTLAFARGLEIVDDDGLLREIAGLVEWPVVLMGAIEDEFLSLPPEVLRTSMKEHQKFLSARNPATGRIEGFVTVANIEAPDGGATILEGNRRVLRARLSDARFFWENDLRVARAGMQEWKEGLRHVTFHNRLGSQWDRVERLCVLSREIAPHVGADPDLAAQAAEVAKLDLRSAMVGEFPELQGLMGRYYAEAAGLPPEVAAAAADHYSPLGPSDDVPAAPVSVAVALADRIDMLTGFWAIDEKPTGSKDPFALRRAALGVVRLLTANGLRMALQPLFGARLPQPVAADLLAFLHDRLKVHLRERGIRHDVIDACLAMPGADDLTLLVRRAEALAAFLKTDDGTNLVQLYKRTANILTQAEERDGVEYSFGADARFAEAAEEHALFAALDAEEPAIRAAMAREDFATAMAALTRLRGPIDAFFEAVQVNADNAMIRRNRLNLLSRIRMLCLSVADLSRIEG
ncbi:glycyl-tRNA synthetase beta chain [Rubellimicrobium thermophilum DSM 16684]|uniref:Glycine--tRNA ligase beta subunit n=1 Tax=Rubellimicrobium thermophilum DSM 16684 TaxID=1123069 RepID=S9R6V8_9RHOB|nr:glycine--tRNA ligase subunit beta [Rubellimicrobium thermophilum]EPX87597.1 glycyl-tRNA synthetase beta chain [Rubellimicrobium thermophilum DSM 16684]